MGIKGLWVQPEVEGKAYFLGCLPSCKKEGRGRTPLQNPGCMVNQRRQSALFPDPFSPNLDAHPMHRQPPEQLHCKTGIGTATWTRSSIGQNPGAGARQGLISLSRSAGALPTHPLHPPQPFPAYLPASPALPMPSSPPRRTFGCSGSPRTRPLSSVHVQQDDVTSAALEETQAVGASAAGVA